MATLIGPRKMLDKINDDVEFRPYQTEGIRWLASVDSFILADDMGLGKSLQSLTVAAIDFEQGYAKRVLVVAPTTVKQNWADELAKHTSFTCEILPNRKPKPKRSALLEAFDADFLIVNYEQVVSHLDQLNRMHFDIVIYDEAHMMKGHKTARSKACRNLVAARHFLLTGSPILGQVNDLWALLNRVDADQFPKYWPFVTRYAVFGGFKDKSIVGVKNEAELAEKLHAVMLRREKSEVAQDLPEKQRIPIYVDLHPKQQEIYDKARDDLLIEQESSVSLEIENPMVKFLRLKQIASTTATVIEDDYSAKLDVLTERVEQVIATGKPTAAFSQFRPTLACAVERFGHLGIPTYELHGGVPADERQGVVAQWSEDAANGKPGVLLANFSVAGVGLNMTAANTAFFIDKLFTPKLNEQAEDRFHRIGADASQPIQIYDIVARNTVEQRIAAILTSKKKVFGAVVDNAEHKRALNAAFKAELGL